MSKQPLFRAGSGSQQTYLALALCDIISSPTFSLEIQHLFAVCLILSSMN